MPATAPSPSRPGRRQRRPDGDRQPRQPARHRLRPAQRPGKAPAPGAAATARAPGRLSAAAPDGAFETNSIRPRLSTGGAELLLGAPCLPHRRSAALNTPEPTASRLQQPMNAPIRELPRTEVPRPLVLVAATACGVLAAIAAQIVLAQRGIELAGVWREICQHADFSCAPPAPGGGRPASALLAGAAVAGRAQPLLPCPGSASGCCAGSPAPPWSPRSPISAIPRR